MSSLHVCVCVCVAVCVRVRVRVCVRECRATVANGVVSHVIVSNSQVSRRHNAAPMRTSACSTAPGPEKNGGRVHDPREPCNFARSEDGQRAGHFRRNHLHTSPSPLPRAALIHGIHCLDFVPLKTLPVGGWAGRRVRPGHLLWPILTSVPPTLHFINCLDSEKSSKL